MRRGLATLAAKPVKMEGFADDEMPGALVTVHERVKIIQMPAQHIVGTRPTRS